jgi:hypothetical protein
VVTNARAYYHTTRGCGCSGARHSLRPLIGEGGTSKQNLERFALRGRTRFSPSLRGALATKQSSFLCRLK